MNDTVLLRRLPVMVPLAVLCPTLLLGLLYAAHFLHLLPREPDLVALGALWLFTTLPLALLAFGMRRIDERWRPGPDPVVAAALEAVHGAARSIERVHQVFDEERRQIASGPKAGKEGDLADLRPRQDGNR